MQKRIRVEGSAEMEIHHFIMKPINIICSFRTFGSNVTHTHSQLTQSQYRARLPHTQVPAHSCAPQAHVLLCPGDIPSLRHRGMTAEGWQFHELW